MRLFCCITVIFVVGTSHAQGPSHPDIPRLLNGIHNDQLKWNLSTFGALVFPTGNVRELLEKAKATDMPAVANSLMHPDRFAAAHYILCRLSGLHGGIETGNYHGLVYEVVSENGATRATYGQKQMAFLSQQWHAWDPQDFAIEREVLHSLGGMDYEFGQDGKGFAIDAFTLKSAATDAILAQLSKLPALRRLTLGDCQQLTAEGISTLGKMNALEFMELSENGKSLRLDAVSNLHKLEHLRINRFKELSRTQVNALCKLPKLRSLAICSIQSIDDTCLQDASQFWHVEKLDLSGCVDISDEGVRHLSDVPSVDLSGCVRLTDACLDSLTDCEQIRLDGCILVAGRGLRYLRDAPRLKYLSLRDCPKIESRHLRRLGKSCLLHELDLSGCVRVDDEGLQFLEGNRLRALMVARTAVQGSAVARFSNLVHLDLSRCPVSSNALEAIAKLKSLEVLVLDGCKNIADDDLAKLSEMDSLRLLSLRKCPQISFDVMDALQRANSALEIDIFD